MAQVRKSVIVPRSPSTMFDLVEDVERYPEFLPWCSGTEVLERTPVLLRARLDIDYHGLAMHFTTLNRKDRPKRMTMELAEGPFERLAGEWRFVPLGEEGCRVELSLDYELASSVLSVVLAPVFGQIAETLVDHFVARAEHPGKPAGRRGR